NTKRQSFASFEEAASQYRDIFLKAVRRRLTGTAPIAITCSGGLDSSSIFCAAEYLKQSGEKLPEIRGIAFYSEQPESDERRFIADVEKKYDVKVHQFPLGRDGLLADSPDQTWVME